MLSKYGITPEWLELLGWSMKKLEEFVVMDKALTQKMEHEVE